MKVALLNIVIDTYYDLMVWTRLVPHNASYMLNNYNRIMKDNWEIVSNNEKKDYKERIQKSLETAIINSGKFMNYILLKINE